MTLADILLMFLCTQVIGMVAVFYTSRATVAIYPIFIAGKDMDLLNIVFEAASRSVRVSTG